MQPVLEQAQNQAEQALARSVHRDPASLLQLLVSISGKKIYSRIANCPTYPTFVNSEDLSLRQRLVFEVAKASNLSVSKAFAAMFQSAVGEDDRKKRGLYFTPTEIARYAVGSLEPKAGETIIDAGCGTGIFASEIMRLLGAKAETITYLGIEIDPTLALSSAIALDLAGAPAKWRIIYRNFLLMDRSQFDSLGVGTIHALIANPPFVRTHRIVRRAGVAQMIGERTGLRFSGHSGLHSLFVAQSVYLLGHHGRAIFLFPSEIAGVQYWFELEKQLASLFEVQRVDLSKLIGMQESTIRWLFRFLPRVTSNRESFDDLDKTASGPDVQLERLRSIASVRRGISTGANDFFVITSAEAARLGVPSKYLVRIIPTRIKLEASNFMFEKSDWDILDRQGKPCWLLHIPSDQTIDELPSKLKQYLREGERRRVPLVPTCKSRKQWFSLKLGQGSPLLVYTYMSRRPRFLYNKAGTYILTNLLGVYPKNAGRFSDSMARDFVAQLNRDFLKWIRNEDAGRVYAGGLRKFEPGDLEQMPVSKGLLGLARLASGSLEDFDKS